jgi:hypothetical protein
MVCNYMYRHSSESRFDFLEGTCKSCEQLNLTSPRQRPPRSQASQLQHKLTKLPQAQGKIPHWWPARRSRFLAQGRVTHHDLLGPLPILTQFLAYSSPLFYVQLCCFLRTRRIRGTGTVCQAAWFDPQSDWGLILQAVQAIFPL